MTREKPHSSGSKIVVGVTGSIACFKTAALVSRLVQLGHQVDVIMTGAATRLVTPHTFRALTDRPVLTDLWEGAPESRMGHLSTVDAATLLVVAPATANFLGKCASGIGDDALTTTVLACRAPILLVPAMNPAMWSNPIVQRNVKTLKDLGYHRVGPETGRLAEGVRGIGRMSEPETILREIERILAAPPDRRR